MTAARARAGRRSAVWGLAVALGAGAGGAGAGCLPRRETFHRAFAGAVVDRAGKPVANVRVDACSLPIRKPGPECTADCEHPQRAVSDAEGRFVVRGDAPWRWQHVLGEELESDQRRTFLIACAGDGRHGFLSLSREPPPTVKLELQDSAADVPAPVVDHCRGR